MSIRLITASDNLFYDMAKVTQAASARVGYQTDIFSIGFSSALTQRFEVPERYIGIVRETLNGDPARASERIVGVSPWKPTLLTEICAREVDQTKTIVWIDSDAWVIRPLTKLETGFFDVAVTLRRQEERVKTNWPEVYGYLNSGVVAIRPTPQAMKFLKLWQLEVDRVQSKSDQHALNNLVRRATDLTIYNRIFKLEDIRIKVVSTDDFNNYYAPEPPNERTAIMHFKRDVRGREVMVDWIEKTKPENLAK